MKTISSKIREAIQNYLVARREFGLTLLGQWIVRGYGRKTSKSGFVALSARQQARGRRIVERGRARIRRRNRRKCWIEITDKGREIQVWLARYGTGYPVELSYEESLEFMKTLREHGDSKQQLRLEFEFGIGRQTLLLDRKLVASAREQMKAIIARRTQEEQDRLNMRHALEAMA